MAVVKSALGAARRREALRLHVGALSVIMFASSFMSPALATDLPPGGSFTDDDLNVHEGAIEAIAAEGITRGCNPPGNYWFCPGESITRGQMAAFLHRALPDLSRPTPNTVGFFTDDDGTVFEQDIDWLADVGITQGCNPPDNTLFCPDDAVTRGEMAAFLRRAFNLPGSTLDAFTDDEANVFESDIDALAASGITKGCTDTEFCPEDAMARDQMASFLTRAVGLPVVEVPSPVWVSVTRIIDGDTIEVEVPFSIEVQPGDWVVGVTRSSLRLIGIDTPEEGEICATEATEAMKALAEDRNVRIDVDVSDVDRYDRLLRYVFSTEDGTFVNEEMVRLGWARAVEYPPDTEYAEVLAIAESEARAAVRGLWGDDCSTTTSTTTSPPSNCDPAYPTVCIPSPPPDLDCADVPYNDFTVLPPDPHGFDGDDDGIGCET